MQVLLDTNAWLWMASDSDRLGLEARRLIVDPETELILSAVSAWEISIKWALGKLTLPVPPEAFVAASLREGGLARRDIRFEDVTRVATLPPIHNDPFDRLLVAQAQSGVLPVLTGDPMIARYGVATIDATR